MKNIYSDVVIKKLEAMRVASYRVISKNPEEEAIGYLTKWLKGNGKDMQREIRYFGFDIPVNSEQKKEGLRGYEYWATIADEVLESRNVKIKSIDADEYAVLRITNPFTNPFEAIPGGWMRLKEWVMNSEYKTTCVKDRYWLEEIIEDENNTYMDIYYPVKDGGRIINARLTDFSVKELNVCRLIGKEIKCSMGCLGGSLIPDFWSKCCEDGTLKRLEGHPDRIYCNAYIGWKGKYNHLDKSFAYIIGVFVKSDTIIPDGFVSIDIPGTQYAVGTIKGGFPDIYMNAHQFTKSELKKAGFEIDNRLDFELEWYDERFSHDEGNLTIDLYIPI